MSLQLARIHTKMMHEKERIDLACAFRWTARMGMHEAVANHLSLAVSKEGTRFLINPKKHFSLIKASDFLLLDADSPPNRTILWALILQPGGSGAIHRSVPSTLCTACTPIYSTVLALLMTAACRQSNKIRQLLNRY
ncbi:MAG: hypothetical protein CM1200mP30_07470 [Pseudomonadota bacterium]|nr:MAG: hypothetical protein CM1200mP30_07470 [Pseudomonadota bacterium]